MTWICKRTENVEYGANTDFLTNRTYKTHCAVIFLRKEENNFVFIKRFSHNLRLTVDFNAERLKAVCSARF